MVSDAFGNEDNARQEVATIYLVEIEKILASFSHRDLLRTSLQRSTCWNSVAVVALMPVFARWESPLSPPASLVPRLPSQERARECW